ncbi:hypothetical protein PV768_18810 [Pseudarthrobacter sp. CC4]|uniref:hypothetical protein n=1 Tax=Pseudarthrobacter sp. CC4 TaxID=3029190 RepID=UPI003B8D9DC1
MNTPVTSGGAALENYKPWQPAEDWTLLEGCDVEVQHRKGLLDQGRVGANC